MHRIISGRGWSLDVPTRELVGALWGAGERQGGENWPRAALQYADYALWQRQWLKGEALERQLSLLARAVGRGRRRVLELPIRTGRVRRRRAFAEPCWGAAWRRRCLGRGVGQSLARARAQDSCRMVLPWRAFQVVRSA
ncbi:hypothetical protein ACRAWD_04260 [Caulobacter segnis]